MHRRSRAHVAAGSCPTARHRADRHVHQRQRIERERLPQGHLQRLGRGGTERRPGVRSSRTGRRGRIGWSVPAAPALATMAGWGGTNARLGCDHAVGEGFIVFGRWSTRGRADECDVAGMTAMGGEPPVSSDPCAAHWRNSIGRQTVPTVGRLWPNQCGGTSRGPAPCVTPRRSGIQVQGGPVPGLTVDGRIGSGPAGCAAAGGRISVRPCRSKMSPSRAARLPP